GGQRPVSGIRVRRQFVAGGSRVEQSGNSEEGRPTASRARYCGGDRTLRRFPVVGHHGISPKTSPDVPLTGNEREWRNSASLPRLLQGWIDLPGRPAPTGLPAGTRS